MKDKMNLIISWIEKAKKDIGAFLLAKECLVLVLEKIENNKDK